MIVYVDPGFASRNEGDRVIADAVESEVVDPIVRAGQDVVRVPLHGPLSAEQRDQVRSAGLVLICGTNLLSANLAFQRIWSWSLRDILSARHRAVFVGVGWWRYQLGGVDPASAVIYRQLQNGIPWALRDSYSADKMNDAGVEAFDSSCPTLWSVGQQEMVGAAGRVVTTLCDYSQDATADTFFLNTLQEKFDEVLFWPQGPKDAAYFASLGISGIGVLDKGRAAFVEALREPSTCYVGLRLHAGIQALRIGVPALILSVDNRAPEIGRTTGLVTPSRYAAREWRSDLERTDKVELTVPTTRIDAWKQSLLDTARAA